MRLFRQIRAYLGFVANTFYAFQSAFNQAFISSRS
nr:MAG TPA: hypothetical protein [Caudoviricetes sp.]